MVIYIDEGTNSDILQGDLPGVTLLEIMGPVKRVKGCWRMDHSQGQSQRAERLGRQWYHSRAIVQCQLLGQMGAVVKVQRTAGPAGRGSL